MNDEDELLLMRVPEVATSLGIAKGLAYAMARDGRLPSVRLGRRAVRVPKARLQEWIAERTREGAAQDDPSRAEGPVEDIDSAAPDAAETHR